MPVVLHGGSVWVSVTTRSVMSDPSNWMRGRPRLVAQKAVIPLLHEALLPAPNAGLRFSRPAHDLIGANAIRAQQGDLSPPDVLVGRCDFFASTFRRRESASLRVMEIPVRITHHSDAEACP